jgi:isoaspartyl peptidase/L-asparaginase-like protein (Ntn-hydrolase superfamily)
MAGVEHAIEVARIVKTETPHVLVAGDRAVALADAFDIATDRDLWTDETRKRWAEAEPPDGDDLEAQLAWVRETFGVDGTGGGHRPIDEQDHDTVGAVATDGDELAAATSTGGRWFALAGRIGDVPQVGAGFYATETAAASATGQGEAIARFGLARTAVDAVEEGCDPESAARRSIEQFQTTTGGTAGVIVLDQSGVTGRAHNAETMATAGSER